MSKRRVTTAAQKASARRNLVAARKARMRMSNRRVLQRDRNGIIVSMPVTRVPGRFAAKRASVKAGRERTRVGNVSQLQMSRSNRRQSRITRGAPVRNSMITPNGHAGDMRGMPSERAARVSSGFYGR